MFSEEVLLSLLESNIVPENNLEQLSSWLAKEMPLSGVGLFPFSVSTELREEKGHVPHLSET